ncbi:hypothetical protein PVAP13_1KG001205 [Panicum virgatum]|uniref:Uncharacterized protein n=1 Tax=Panicum virgatum TaxID=38727 RepID=A0A8T0XRD0_PANVG|nr:hypothetical protein PVAP13_1KG001205 [Panicum virgatum]
MHCAHDGTGRRPLRRRSSLRRPPDSREPSRAQHPRRWPPLPARSPHRSAPARAAASPAPPLPTWTRHARRCCPRRPACRNSLPRGRSRALAAAQAAAAASSGSQHACAPPQPLPPLACVPTARARERRSWTRWGTGRLVSRPSVVVLDRLRVAPPSSFAALESSPAPEGSRHDLREHDPEWSLKPPGSLVCGGPQR